ncbi:MAG: nucleotide exchange factor GrpE [Clostridia bacterium]|nr:nucleotide exchange factor GrpE [Clostridia bacterium]
MKKEKNVKNSDDEKEKKKNLKNDQEDIDLNAEKSCEETNENDHKRIEAMKAELDEKTKKCDEYLDKLQRTAAEFDNYKKRTAREKETVYQDSIGDVITAFLPVVDSLERAVLSADNGDEASIKDGINLVLKQMKEIMKNFGVEEIKSVGETFDPQLHNAVMHIEDENYGENVVADEFQKGYIIKDKVIRHSMVKVAN